jgi:hypothetical protein
MTRITIRPAVSDRLVRRAMISTAKKAARRAWLSDRQKRTIFALGFAVAMVVGANLGWNL